PDARVVEEALAVLREDGIVVYPTETFYGLAVDARSRAACDRLFELKGRPPEKALPCIVSGVPQLEEVARSLGNSVFRLARKFWPGPLTLVIEAKPGLLASSPEGGLAVRASGLRLPRDLAEGLGAPITATSANHSGAPPATTAEEVLSELGSELDLVLDGGACPGGLPSTIVDVRGTPPRLVREGRVSFAEVERVVSGLPPP
ncbi:MAG: L-threonylcarbamoyladenylate synthase, partial [Vicinamibacteria bacterium]